MNIHFLLSHKQRGAGSFGPFDPRLQKRGHRPAVSTHLKPQMYTSIPQKMGTKNEPLSYVHWLYCWRSRPFSDLFEIARDLKNCFSTTFWTIRSCRLHFWGALSKWHSIWENFFSPRARTPNLGYVVLGAPGNVCKHFSISSYLEKAGKGAWPPTVQ